MSALISRSPCEVCDAAATEIETGAGYCLADPDGDFDCELTQLVAELVEIAGQVALHIARFRRAEMRREAALSAADGFANALFEAQIPASFDAEAFIAACNAQRVKEAA